MNLPFDGAWYQNLTPDVNDQIHIINIFDFFFKKYVRIRSWTLFYKDGFINLKVLFTVSDPRCNRSFRFESSSSPLLSSPISARARGALTIAPRSPPTRERLLLSPHHRRRTPSSYSPSQETGWSEWKRTRWSASGRRSSTPTSSTSPSAAAGRRYAQSPLQIPFRSTHARPPWIRARDVDLPQAEHFAALERWPLPVRCSPGGCVRKAVGM